MIVKLTPHTWRSWTAWVVVVPKPSSIPGVNASWQKHVLSVAFISLIGLQQVSGGFVEFINWMHGDSCWAQGGTVCAFAKLITVMPNTKTQFIINAMFIPISNNTTCPLDIALISWCYSSFIYSSKSQIASLDICLTSLFIFTNQNTRSHVVA